MLNTDFFRLLTPLTEGNSIKATIEINASHEIFNGHFPEQPIVPGVCMIQLVKEVLEQLINRETRLIKADNLKFLALLDPRENNQVDLELKFSSDNEDQIRVESQIFNSGTVFFKFKGTFI